MEKQAKFKNGSEVWIFEGGRLKKVTVVTSWEDVECSYNIEGLFLYRCYSEGEDRLTGEIKETHIYSSKLEAVLSLLTGRDITLQINEYDYVLTIKKEG